MSSLDTAAQASPRSQVLPNDELLDERAASEFLGGVSVRTLQRWRAQRIGPAWLVIGSRLVRYQRSSLTRFLEAGVRIPTDSAP